MDTTAAAELGMGMVGDGVNYWAPEEEYDDTAELPSNGGENLEYGPGQHRPLPSGAEPANKRMKMIPGNSQGYADYGDVSGSQYGYWPYGGMWDAAGMGVQWQGGASGMMSEAYSGGPDMAYGSLVPPGSDSAGGGRGKGAGSIFYKTKLCSNFKLGNCPFDTRCNFAHGMEELRKPPPGWESMVGSQEPRPTFGLTQGAGRGYRGPPDVQKFKTRPCKYFREGNCPYAERCTFLHDSPGNPAPVGNDNICWSASEAAGNVLFGRGPGRPPNWKTRICNQWENTGQCSFAEKCHFAHGAAELQKHGGGPVDGSDNGAPKLYLKQIDAEGSSNERLTKDGPYGDWVDEQEQGNGHFSEAGQARSYPVGGFGQYPHQFVPYFRPYMYGHYPGQNGIFRKGNSYQAQDDVGYRGEYGQEAGYNREDDSYDNSYDHQGWTGEYSAI